MEPCNYPMDELICKFGTCHHSHNGEITQEFTSFLQDFSEEEISRIYSHFEIPSSTERCCRGCLHRIHVYTKSLREQPDEKNPVFINVNIRDVIYKTVENDLLEHQYLEEQKKVQEERTTTPLPPMWQANPMNPHFPMMAPNFLNPYANVADLMNSYMLNSMLPVMLNPNHMSLFMNSENMIDFYNKAFCMQNIINNRHLFQPGSQRSHQYLSHQYSSQVVENNGVTPSFQPPNQVPDTPEEAPVCQTNETEGQEVNDPTPPKDVAESSPNLNDTIVSVIQRVGGMQVVPNSDVNLDSSGNSRNGDTDDDVGVQKRKSSAGDLASDRVKRISETNL